MNHNRFLGFFLQFDISTSKSIDYMGTELCRWLNAFCVIYCFKFSLFLLNPPNKATHLSNWSTGPQIESIDGLNLSFSGGGLTIWLYVRDGKIIKTIEYGFLGYFVLVIEGAIYNQSIELTFPLYIFVLKIYSQFITTNIIRKFDLLICKFMLCLGNYMDLINSFSLC